MNKINVAWGLPAHGPTKPTKDRFGPSPANGPWGPDGVLHFRAYMICIRNRTEADRERQEQRRSNKDTDKQLRVPENAADAA